MKSKRTNYSISTKTNIVLPKLNSLLWPIVPCPLNRSCYLLILNVCLVGSESEKVKVFDTISQSILKSNNCKDNMLGPKFCRLFNAEVFVVLFMLYPIE